MSKRYSNVSFIILKSREYLFYTSGAFHVHHMLYIERMFRMLPSLLLCFISLKTFSQDAEIFKPDSIRKEIDAIHITTSLHIDGVLNEPEWRLAKPSPRFTQIEPYQGAAPNFETFIKV